MGEERRHNEKSKLSHYRRELSFYIVQEIATFRLDQANFTPQLRFILTPFHKPLTVPWASSVPSDGMLMADSRACTSSNTRSW
jgi:hypothetical protein